jgi:hypothetical protein
MRRTTSEPSSGAYRSLLRLRKRPILAFRDLIVLREQLMLEEKLLNLEGYDAKGHPAIIWLNRFKELITIRRTRNATIASVTVSANRAYASIFSNDNLRLCWLSKW